jgi:hypothetical protein
VTLQVIVEPSGTDAVTEVLVVSAEIERLDCAVE